ncbi:MAG: hypothetical protein KJ749_13465, partial [Planctomycetes bacterium]|nr:hypothetical protein [Planctomycetota bacterium]
MLRSKVYGIALLSGAVLVGASAPAQAGFTLELRPISQSVADGQTVELGLYAVGVPDQEVGVVLAVL